MSNRYEVQHNRNPDFRTAPFNSLDDARADRQQRVDRESRFNWNSILPDLIITPKGDILPS